MNYMEKIKETIKFIQTKIDKKPQVALILGSGLGSLADEIVNPIKIKYEDIPNFPKSTVEGHAGQLVIGNLAGKLVIAMQGRFHFYEGYDLNEVTFPVRVMNGLGIESLIVTNAAGGVNTDFKPGDLMLISDHINFTGENPLMGQNIDQLGPRFLDMTWAYDRKYMNIAKKAAEKQEIEIKTGAYMWFTGPTYETPMEVKMARVLGADAVGMSTVPEVIIANHEGVRVLGISCITNMASGILDQALDHKDVVETSIKVKEDFQKLILEILANI